MQYMLKKLLQKYPEGSDITVMNMMYQYSRKREDGSRDPDFLIIVIKDNTTGNKDHIVIKNPKYKFYIAKDYVNIDHNLLFIEKDKVDEYMVPYSRIDKEVAILTGQEGVYNDAIAMRDKEAIRRIHMHPRVFNSDQSIEDHYREEFSQLYTNNITKLHKGFFDIEVDIKYQAGDFVQMGECPINAISFQDDTYDKGYTFLLRDPRNPLIAQLEEEYKTGKFTPLDIHNFVEKSVGGYKQMHRLGLKYTKFRLFWFDTEVELLRAFFNTVYKLDPDFVMGWNSSAFDLNYIIARLDVLGENPAQFMSDPRWEEPYLKHYVDQLHINEFAERGDYTNIACNTVWIDQMIQYCSRRKAKMGSYTSFKLDDIGYITAKVNKLDYSHITTDLALLPELDYKTFVLYNIMDTVVQRSIEVKCNDLEYIFAKCIVNCTSYKKGHRQTVYLINRMNKEWDKLGYVIGNNKNKFNPEPEKFPGAMVGDPLKTSSYSKIVINGIPIFVCDNLQDYDFKSLYPSIELEDNIAPNTQIGRIDIPNKVYSGENPYNNDKYTRAGNFIEDYVSDYNIEFLSRWLHLAGIKEFLEDWKEYNAKYRPNTNPGYFGVYGIKDNKLAICPIIDQSTVVSPIIYDLNYPQAPFYSFENLKQREVNINAIN